MLAGDISLYALNLRNLNLSYNTLNFVDDPGYEESIEFMEHMCRFFKKKIYLNHVNFAGMNFDRDNLLSLVSGLKNCSYLVSIHLSNNNIT